jgi:hypothetical protein
VRQCGPGLIEDLTKKQVNKFEQWPSCCGSSFCTRMGAQNETRRQSCRVLRCIATARIEGEDQALEARVARCRVMNFLLDTNAVSEWVKPQPIAGLMRNRTG